jgi:hypothetical protein
MQDTLHEIQDTNLSPSTTVERTLQIRPFYAKQTQFWNCKMNVTSASTNPTFLCETNPILELQNECNLSIYKGLRRK